MDANVQKCVDKTLVFEGGLADNPNDPGGRTYKGVTQRVYNSYRQGKGLPLQDVALMSDDECYDIYEHQYFIPTFAPQIADIKCQWKVFDIGVNMGVSRSLKFTQSLIGVVADGQFGSKSQDALSKYQLVSGWQTSMVNSLCTMQAQRYKDLVVANPKLQEFLKGWLRRASDAGNSLA